MMSQRFQQVAAIFGEASARGAREREAYLDEACGADALLREEVERLLTAEEALPRARAEASMKDHVREFPAPEASSGLPSVLPERVGRYSIRQVLEEGGMGRVYVAVQEQPRRTVALKVMKASIASKSALRRFEFESQILARLRHPNIAQVYEAGVHEEGRLRVPYFAMEYVPGARPITDFAREKKLELRKRLELFAKVCDAVHHGHQKGIIHRDLKPGNVLVDSAGEPKIIDFGVARATDSDLAVTTLQTDIGQLIGTMQYMSPEQCAADPHDIDTRSDVYSLGVMLYELLCERLPYELTGVPINRAATLICDAKPARPRSINRHLGGDLETITCKTLEKEREHRYQSAAELAQDIRRYLADEPIAARPPNVIYQLRMFARRNRNLVTAAGTGVGVLILALVVISVQFLLTTAALDREELVRRDLREAIAIISDMGALIPADPLATKDPPVRAKVERLATLVDHLDAALIAPGEAANLHRILGLSFLNVRESEQAEKHLRRVLELRAGAPAMEVAQASHDLGRALYQNARLNEALEVYQRAVDIRRREYGPESELYLQSLHDLAGCLRKLGRFDEAEEHQRNVLQTRRRIYPDDHTWISAGLNNLAVCLRSRGQYEEALELFEEALELYQQRMGGEASPRILAAASRSLGTCCVFLGRFPEALRHINAATEQVDRLTSGQEIERISTDGLRARLWYEQGLFASAESECRTALQMINPDAPSHQDERAALITLLARAMLAQSRSDEAGEQARESLKLRSGMLPSTHPDVAESQVLLAQVLMEDGAIDEAAELCDQALAAQRAALVPDHPELIDTLTLRASLCLARGEVDQGRQVLRAVIESCEEGTLRDRWRHKRAVDLLASSEDQKEKG